MSTDTIVTPWKNPEDLLDRKQYADFLTVYLANKETAFVLNLNAEWGAGKTYFLENWHEDIKQKKVHASIYINAWESDFSDDPLIAVMSSLFKQLEAYLPKSDKNKEIFSQLKQNSAPFIKNAISSTPKLISTITKGLSITALGEEQAEEVKEILAISSDIIEKSISELLTKHENNLQSMTNFKIKLGELIERVDSKKPLFIFIDELDRCRPTYAIELLETVKHLFSVNGIVFVIATDSEQLQHSVKAIYGNDFNGSEYLRRFFDQEYALPAPDYIKYCQSLANNTINIDKLHFGSFDPTSVNGATGYTQGVENKSYYAYLLAFYARHFELSPRTVKQVTVRMEAILCGNDDTNYRQKEWDAIFLLLLLVLQAKDRNDFDWLNEHYKKNDLMANNNHIKKLTIILRPEGDDIKWRNEKRYNVHDIGHDYFNAIAKIKKIPEDALSHHTEKKPGWCNNLFSQLTILIASDKCNNHNARIDIATYFDHVKMAGALS